MNDPVNHPPDDANDPLLAALRARLGDYGAPPPPGAWADIRQRLPPAPARPWWRRPRRLLPLLALLVFTAALTGYLLRRPSGHPGALSAAHTRPGVPARVATSLAPAGRVPAPSRQLDSQPLRPEVKLSASAATGMVPTGSVPTVPAATGLASALSPAASSSARAPLTTANNNHRSVMAPQLGSQLLASHATSHKKLFTNKLPIKLPISHLPISPTSNHPKTGHLAAQQLAGARATPAAGKLRQYAALPPADRSQRATVALTQRQLAARRASTLTATTFSGHRHIPELTRLAHPKWPRPLAMPSSLAQRPARQYGSQLAETTAPKLAAGHQLQVRILFPTSIQPTDSQYLRRALLSLPMGASLPASLAARPDSSQPAPPVRRWAVLATAGPTLSYRTIGPTPTALAFRPDFAHLERPTLGFGAQVQVRRVLAGRWALAVGLGYHEYATSLALQQADSGRTTQLKRRDTYRLLTLPGQLSYALGAPRGRLAKALLLGAEVGWYRSGRSTEGSDSTARQQTYSATASPYRPWSLALSLGLDLRYRLGSPTGRWQWLVQPTGRYVLTPFTKPQATTFSARQPFSLGLLTGFSWDIR